MPQDIVYKLIKHFYNGSLKFSLERHELDKLNWERQEAFINATINNKRLKEYPMSNTFCRLFFKKLVDALESNQEVHDEMYTFLCNSMKNSIDVFHYKHYLVDNNFENMITIKETKNIVIDGTTGMRTWQAALMLADFALSNKSIFKGKHILELGSGVGFTGITIAKNCNVHSILLTDCHDEVIKTIRDNIKTNFPELVDTDDRIHQIHKNIDVAVLDWNYVEDFSEDLIPDVLIGADIVYDPSIIKPLCNVIKTFFNKNRGLEVYIANIIRNEDTFKRFINTLDEMNLKWKEISQDNSINIEWDNTIQKCLLKIIFSS